MNDRYIVQSVVDTQLVHSTAQYQISDMRGTENGMFQ